MRKPLRDLKIHGVPDYISERQVITACEALGIDPKGVSDIHIGTKSVSVSGRPLRHNEQPMMSANFHVTIPVFRGADDGSLASPETRHDLDKEGARP